MNSQPQGLLDQATADVIDSDRAEKSALPERAGSASQPTGPLPTKCPFGTVYHPEPAPPFPWSKLLEQWEIEMKKSSMAESGNPPPESVAQAK